MKRLEKTAKFLMSFLIQERSYTIILCSAQINKWLLDSSNQSNFVNAMRENHFVRLYATLLRQYCKEFCYSPLNLTRTICDYINY